MSESISTQWGCRGAATADGGCVRRESRTREIITDDVRRSYVWDG